MENKIDFINISTGSYNNRNSIDREVHIEVPKPDEDEKEKLLPGLAKASPNFKPIIVSKPIDQKAEEKAIAENIVNIKKNDNS